MNKVKRNLWSALIDEAKAHILYKAYSQRAREEGLQKTAELFEKVAEAEMRHALSHLRALGEIQSTRENLQKVVEVERYEAEVVFPRMLEEVQKMGPSEAVSSLAMAVREGKEHIQWLEQAFREMGGASPQKKPLAEPPAQEGIADEIRDEKGRIAILERIREVVFGMQDGVISTMAVASSIMIATGDSFMTLAAGLASGVAGTISMSTGTYLASKSEKELHEAELEKEKEELQLKPEEETAELVELYRKEGFSYEEAVELAEKVSSDPKLWLKTLAEKELGLSLETPFHENPLKDASTMGVSFLIGAALSLLPYVWMKGIPAVYASVVVSLSALFLIGVLKTKVTRQNPWISGLEVLGIGALSAFFGYLLGRLLPFVQF